MKREKTSIDEALSRLVSPMPTQEQVDQAGRDANAVALRVNSFSKPEYKAAESHWRALRDSLYSHAVLTSHRSHVEAQLKSNSSLRAHLENEILESLAPA